MGRCFKAPPFYVRCRFFFGQPRIAMIHRPKDHKETLAAIKDAIYDLKIGPSEIGTYPGDFPAFTVGFDARDGTSRELVIPIPSMYESVCQMFDAALKSRER